MRQTIDALPAAARAATAPLPPLAEAILKSFNTWAYKREQPSDLDAILRAIEMRAAAEQPIDFVLYWGKGPRDTLAPPDRQCLDYLATMGQRIAAVYSAGAHFTLLLTDTHARLNGHAESAIASYFEAVSRAAGERGMACVRLGQLVARLPAELSDAAGIPHDAAAGGILDMLGTCAAKWYRGGDDVAEGARRYLAMNMVERLAVETQFPQSIFITFNGSAYRSIFPQRLPVFYMYSLRRGTSVKPWFLDGDGMPFGDAPRQKFGSQ